jgi:hypothetical protein
MQMQRVRADIEPAAKVLLMKMAMIRSLISR